MYPKKPPTSSGPSDTKSKKTLNFEQRQQLQQMITDKLAQQYGISNQDLIYNQVSAYLNANSVVTAVGLQQLQNRIKSGGTDKGSVGNMSMFTGVPPINGGGSKINNQKLEPLQQPPSRSQNNKENSVDGRQNHAPAATHQNKKKKDDDEESVQSGFSKMSGASNFDNVDRFTHKKPSETELKESQKNKDKKLQTLNPQQPENDLAFLDEENEWAAIYKYNNYLFQKEQEMLRQKAIEQKERLRAELDRQVNEKQNIQKMEQHQLESYTQNVKLQMEMYDEREREKQQEARRLREAQKEAREKQVKDNKQKRRFEVKQEKALDTFLMQKVQEELIADQQYQQFKKTHQAEVMKQLLEENEIKLARDRDNAERERQENIELMNAYVRLIQKQDEQREKALKERDEKMQEFQRLALENVYAAKEDKFAVMDKRREQYERRHEQQLDQRERQRIEKERKQKEDMKEYLFKQMDMNQQKKIEEKQNFNEQAEIWKKDNEHFQNYEKTKIQEKQQSKKEYKDVLKNQMANNAESQQQGKANMNENDLLLNKQLLDELEKAKYDNLKA